MTAMLSVDNLSVEFGAKDPTRVLDDISFQVNAGECVGLVGESGAGKSTAIRCIMRLTRPTHGSVSFEGEDVWAMNPKAVQRFRRNVQIIFQDPKASLNPRMTVAELVEEGLIVHRLEADAGARRHRVREALDSVGLGPDTLDRRPAAFSGGQQQRIAIARALALKPRLLVCDEPVSALDVSVQAQVINLLQDLQRDLGLAVLFVAHDLAVVRHLCENVNILAEGRIVESGPQNAIFEAPAHQYTKALLAAVPVPDPGARPSRATTAERVTPS